MAKKIKTVKEVVEEVKDEGIKVEIVSDADYVERREPSGKLVKVYEDGRIEPVR